MGKLIDNGIAEIEGDQQPVIKAVEDAKTIPQIDLEAVARHMATMDFENDVPPVEHIFTEGTYTRKMEIPAGHFVIGKHHVEAGLNFIPSGRIVSYCPEQLLEIEGPYIFTSPPGKKMVYAITDTIWCNVIKTELKTVEEIEARYIKPEKELLV